MTSDAKKAAKDTVEGLSEKAGAATSSAQQAAADLRDSASDFAARAGETASDLYGRAQERAKDAADRMPDTAADAVAAGKRAYDKGSKTIGRKVAKQPIEALLLAAAIGYLVGWATTRS